jgi:hypothetical protein
MQGNDINIIVVTDKVKWEVGLVGQKTKRETFHYVSSFGECCGLEQCVKKWHWIWSFIKDRLVSLQPVYSKCFLEAVSDKYKWITYPFHVDSPPPPPMTIFI